MAEHEQASAAEGQGFDEALQAAIDGKTKPVGSLGDLETLAQQIARIQRTLVPRVSTCELTLFAGDHGLAQAGVSAFPREVTRQMVLNFLSGTAAANVIAAALGASLAIVDAGVAGERIAHAQLRDLRIAAGTQNSLYAPAMSREQFELALNRGRRLGREQTADVCCLGEMGIGNTSAAALVAAKILGLAPEELAGRGTGLDEDGLRRKRALLAQAGARTNTVLDAAAAMTEYAGFEMVMMSGAMLGAAEAGRVVIVDGFIATAAALCARQLHPAAAAAFVFGHRSAEFAHAILLEELQAKPLLDLNLRLGEGTGALLAWPLVKAASAVLSDMASFTSAGVSGPA